LHTGGRYVIFRHQFLRGKEGNVGTTKLTRKEILAEDPVHGAIIHLIELFHTQGKKIGLGAGALVLVAIGVYFTLQYLDSREAQAQARLGRGMEFFHATVTTDAANDPYGKGSTPLFRSDTAKYKAAASEFSSVISGYRFSNLVMVARYYLALSQIELGQKKEAIQNLEICSTSSGNRTISNLAKRTLALQYLEEGNAQKAQEIIERMLKDTQCDLPKEDLQIQMSRILMAQNKRDAAIKVLQNNSQADGTSMFGTQVMEELQRLQRSVNTGPGNSKPASVQP
jgi:tetratricopeptide (TPR) repeat protein